MSRRAFCRDIRRAIMDEREAFVSYTAIARRAPRRNISRIIIGIREDEHRHKAILTRLLRRYC